jgi:L-seryl-tRNA(Ser) seleniumtransferase
VLADLLHEFRAEPVTDLVRRVLDEQRAAALAGAAVPPPDAIARAVLERVAREWRAGPRRVLNATGVVLHTNLARSPLSDAAVSAMNAAARYSDVELDLREGARGDRQSHARLLTALTGAEAAHVTVSAAAALLLALSALARRKEVVVSRGQAVEIGGGFRIPVVLGQSGARLVDVGTTNRTRLSDYDDAITDRTAGLLHVHASNFRIVGYTESVALQDLAGLAHRRGIPLIDDNGSGALLDTARFGLAHEPTVQESLAAGSDVVVFSGDKLLGGPQAGIILGTRELVGRLARHPLARAVRPDKLTLAALSATVLPYLRGDAERTVPVWRMISMTPAEIERRAGDFRDRAAGAGLDLELRPGESAVGGGSLPGETLPTTHLVLPRSLTASRLRQTDPAVIALTRDGRTLVDLRTIPEREEPDLLQALLSPVAPASRV